MLFYFFASVDIIIITTSFNLCEPIQCFHNDDAACKSTSSSLSRHCILNKKNERLYCFISGTYKLETIRNGHAKFKCSKSWTVYKHYIGVSRLQMKKKIETFIFIHNHASVKKNKLSQFLELNIKFGFQWKRINWKF